MAHGTSENTGITYAHIVNTKQGEEAKFVFVENNKESDGNFIEGYITDITLSSYPWKGETIPTYIIHMTDGVDKIKLDTSWTGMARTILNALSSMDLYGKVKIQIKSAKSKDEYNSVFVNVDEAPALKWKYKFDDIKDKIIPANTDANPSKFANYDELDKFFQDLITDTLGPFVRKGYAEAQKSGLMKVVAPVVEEDAIDLAAQDEHEESEKAENLPIVEEENDDLPF